MDKKKAAAGNSSGANKTTQASDPLKTASTHERNNVRMVKNTLLIWLDNNIDQNSADYRNTTTEFRRVVDTVNTFTDGDECIQFIESMNNEKAYMVISGSLGQHIVPRVHNMPQVNSIFIFCGNKKYHEQWAKEWPKIKGVFTEITQIREAIKQAAQQCEQDSIPISFVATSSSGISFGDLNQLDSSFMYTKILKEILLSIEFEQKHIREFIDYCRVVFAENKNELKNVDKLEREYRDHQPIWWYTLECFLYAMLNRALRQTDVDIIIKMGFFICDLHRHIEQLHSEQFSGDHSRKTFMVYRGQGLSKADFERMKKLKGGLMSFSNFLSTQRVRQVSLQFAQAAMQKPDLVGILFAMTIDPSQSTTPFASIDGVSTFPGEEEVLFSMHTIFRIRDIKAIDGNRLFQVDLTLTSDEDQQLRALTDRFREENCDHPNPWYQLGLFLLKMGQFGKAQQVYETILEQTPDKREKGNLYHQIGTIKVDQGEYQEAIEFYEKSVKICEETLLPNHPHLASSYTNIGLVYDKIGEYSKALLSHEKALRIYQKIRPPNHPDLASTYNNIGLVYNNMGEYSKALSSHEKALEIRKMTLPPNHPDLASSYNNIGLVYNNMGEHSKALSFHEKSSEIRERTLPPNHPDLASSYNSIGLVYKNMGEYSKALSFHERAVNIGQNSLTSNHPDLQTYRKNLESVKKK